MRTLVLDVPAWPGHRAGHVDVRLTAEDGQQALRSYSIASAPEHDAVELTIVRFEDVEVSPYLVDDVIAGNQSEVHEPIGGYFVWEERPAEPLCSSAAARAVPPLRAMLRHHLATGSSVPLRVLYSARSLADLIYRDELMRTIEDNGLDIRFTLTRQQPAGWRGCLTALSTGA